MDNRVFTQLYRNVSLIYLKCRVKTLGFTDGMKPDQYQTAKHDKAIDSFVLNRVI
jgi:hypothetical protein